MESKIFRRFWKKANDKSNSVEVKHDQSVGSQKCEGSGKPRAVSAQSDKSNEKVSNDNFKGKQSNERNKISPSTGSGGSKNRNKKMWRISNYFFKSHSKNSTHEKKTSPIQQNNNQQPMKQYATIDINGQTTYAPVTFNLLFNQQPLTTLPISSSNPALTYDNRNTTTAAAVLPPTVESNQRGPRDSIMIAANDELSKKSTLSSTSSTYSTISSLSTLSTSSTNIMEPMVLPTQPIYGLNGEFICTVADIMPRCTSPYPASKIDNQLMNAYFGVPIAESSNYQNSISSISASTDDEETLFERIEAKRIPVICELTSYMTSNDDFEPTLFEDVRGGLKPAIFEMRSAKLNGDDEPTEFENVEAELRPAKMKMRTRHAITRTRKLAQFDTVGIRQIDRTSKKRISPKSPKKNIKSKKIEDTRKTTKTMKKKKAHSMQKGRKKNVIVTDIGGKRRCIITDLEHPTKDDNPLAKATRSLVAIAPQSILIKTHAKITSESPMKFEKEIEEIFEKRDQERNLIEPETAREPEEATARLIELDNAQEIQVKITHPIELKTARETEETTACLIEPETARETEETTACLPDKEAYRKFKERLKNFHRSQTSESWHIGSSILKAKSPSTAEPTTARSGTFSEIRFISSSAINRQSKVIGQQTIASKNEKRIHQKKVIPARRKIHTKIKSISKEKREKREKHHHRHKYSTLKKRVDGVVELKTGCERITSADAHIPVRGKSNIETEVHKGAEICEDEFGNPIKITPEELNGMDVIAEEKLQEEEDKKAKEETKKIVVTMEKIQIEEHKLPQQKKEAIIEVSVKELKRVVKVELNEEEVLLQHTQGEENDLLTDKTISEKSEEEITAALDDSYVENMSTNDSETVYKTIHSMDTKILNEKYRQENLLKEMPQEIEIIQKQNTHPTIKDH